MIDFTGHVPVVFPHQNKRRLANVFQAAAGVVALARKQMTQARENSGT